MSWLWRGFQSAVFYYLSCAPCTKIAYQRRRHKATQRAKAERAATEMEHGLYQHPSPFSTNIYWREEMALGPGPPQRKGNKDRDRRKTESSRGLRSGGAGSSSITGTSSADTVVEMEVGQSISQVQTYDDGWNHRRYQREDENLWGNSCDSVTSMSRSSTTGSRTGYYYVARNPAVNDLHPPVVSTQPTHPSQTRWMLQPPPSAKIMEGKMKSPRMRSGSGTSNGSDSSRKRDDMSLGRKVGERLMEEKVKRGEGVGLLHSGSVSTSASMFRLPSRESAKSEVRPQGQPHDRDTISVEITLPAASLQPGSDDFRPRRIPSHISPPITTISPTSNPSPQNPNITTTSSSSPSSQPPLPSPHLSTKTTPHNPPSTSSSSSSSPHHHLTSKSPSTLNIPPSKPLAPPPPSPSPPPPLINQKPLGVHNHHSEDRDFPFPIHTHNHDPNDDDYNDDDDDKWWFPPPPGEMDWRFSLDTRQRQLENGVGMEGGMGVGMKGGMGTGMGMGMDRENKGEGEREGEMEIERRRRTLTKRWSMDI